MSFITAKFHEILSSGFRGVALIKKNPGLTDLLKDGSKTLYPLQLDAWGIFKRKELKMDRQMERERMVDWQTMTLQHPQNWVLINNEIKQDGLPKYKICFPCKL